VNTRWIAIAEVAALLHMSRETVRVKLETGEIPGLVEHFGTARVERAKFDVWYRKYMGK
jgi:hypothetical protein